MSEKDRRSFKRYKKKFPLILTFENKIFHTECLNYSPSGIAFFSKYPLYFKEGAHVEVSAEEQGIKMSGQIVWCRNEKDGTVCAIKNTGRIKECCDNYGLSDVLIGIQRTSKTGILVFQSGTIEKKIYIKNGDMIFASSNQTYDRLGDLLLRVGKINKKQYDESVELLKKTGKRHGTILVELGYLKPAELVWAVNHYAEEVILSMFDFKDPEFELIEGNLPTNEVITLKISAANIIYRGCKRIQDIEDSFVSRFSLDSTVTVSDDPHSLFQDISLNISDKKILALIEGGTVNELLSKSPLNRAETLQILYALINIRMIEVVEGLEAAAKVVPRDIFNMMKEEPLVVIDEKTAEEIDRMWQTYQTLGYYGVLGVDRGSDLKEIEKSYYSAAKKYHPDRHFKSIDLSLKNKLYDIFDYINQAYLILSDPNKRKEYDKAFQ